MRNLFYFIFCTLLVVGCKEKNADSSKNEITEDFSGTPSKIVKEDSLSIEIFDFKNFEPLLNKDNDSIYIINFWATWCKPCVKELPDIEKIQREYADKKVKVVLTSLDFPDKITSQLIPFVKKMDLQSRVIVLDEPDANSWIPKISPQWSGAIPATLIYSKQNRVFHSGPITYEELKNEIDRLTPIKN